jgi:hypothetical protein
MSNEIAATEQSLSARAVANISAPSLAIPGFTVAKQVTRNVLKQVDDKWLAWQSEGEIYEGEALEKERGKEPEMAPAHLMHVINLETREKMVLVMNTVLQGELERAYPDGSYVGKYFASRRRAAAEGKRYKVYDLMELHPAEDAPNGVTAEFVADGENPVNRKGNKPGTRKAVDQGEATE